MLSSLSPHKSFSSKTKLHESAQIDLTNDFTKNPESVCYSLQDPDIKPR